MGSGGVEAEARSPWLQEGVDGVEEEVARALCLRKRGVRGGNSWRGKGVQEGVPKPRR